MDVAIAGGHGKIARRLARLLVERGDRVRGLVRKPEHAVDLRGDGSDPVLCDLGITGAEEVATAIAGADAVVFAAGAGPGSGAERKLTIDRDGAIKLLEAARNAGVERYVMASSIGAENLPDDDDVFSVYLRAKAEADRALTAGDRERTIGGPSPHRRGRHRPRATRRETDRRQASRDDVAAVLAAVLHERRSRT